MPQFMIAYHGGDQPSSKEEGMAHMKKWQEWVAGLGNTVVNPGTPFTGSKNITSQGVSDDVDPGEMKGFAIIEAENFDKALEIAKTDPFLQINGRIRLSEMMEMQ